MEPLCHGAWATAPSGHGRRSRARRVAARGCRWDVLVLELPDGPGRTRERAAATAPIGGDEAEQEDDRLTGDEQETDRREQQHGAQPVRPVPRRAERRQDDENGEQHELESEATKPRASLRFEVLTLVLDGAGRTRRTRRGGVGTGVGSGHEPERYGRGRQLAVGGGGTVPGLST